MERKKKYGLAFRYLGGLLIAAVWGVSGVAEADSPSWPLALRAQMARLNNVGYRLGVVAAPICPLAAAGTGIGLDYLEAYEAADRPGVRALLGLSDFPQVAAIAPGSPADTAGVKSGDHVIAINGVDVSQLLSASADTSLFADELEQRFAATPRGGSIRLRLRRGGRIFDVEFMPRPICSARLILKTGLGVTAFSDGVNVAISSKLIAFTDNDDELALIVAHEMAHVINRDGTAANLTERRRMEDQADLLGVRIVRCTHYDPEQGFRFWLRRDRSDWLRMFRDPSHRSRKARVELMRKENATISCPLATAVPIVGKWP